MDQSFSVEFQEILLLLLVDLLLHHFVLLFLLLFFPSASFLFLTISLALARVLTLLILYLIFLILLVRSLLIFLLIIPNLIVLHFRQVIYSALLHPIKHSQTPCLMPFLLRLRSPSPTHFSVNFSLTSHLFFSPFPPYFQNLR
jgi:hypothetical protein